MQTKTVSVPSISCGHCVMTIKNEVSELAGVQSVDASPDTKMVTVNWDEPANWSQIESLLVEINFPPAA